MYVFNFQGNHIKIPVYVCAALHRSRSFCCINRSLKIVLMRLPWFSLTILIIYANYDYCQRFA